MSGKCRLCYASEASPEPVPGWIEAIQHYLDYQPHPKKVDGLVPCDRRVFEDNDWFCVVEREPMAEGHVRLICKHHITDLSQLRGPTEDEVEAGDVASTRSSLLDNLIIAHDVVLGYDERVVGAVVVSGARPEHHLYFDVVPIHRFSEGTLQQLGEAEGVYSDISPQRKRVHWTQRVRDFEDIGERLRKVAGRVIRGRPGRRRAGLVAGDEQQ